MTASIQWPDELSFASFKRLVKTSDKVIYKQLYEQHSCSIRNQKIAVKNLQKICEATFLLANEVGFQAMTLRQLSNQTGMSMGGLYSYIKSKDELAELIYQFLNQYCIEKIRQLVSDDLPVKQKLVALIHAHLYLSELMQPWFYFAYMETKNLSKNHKSFAINSELTMEMLLFETIEQGIDDSVFTDSLRSNPHSNNALKTNNDNVQLTASLIKAMLQDWYLKRWKYKKRKITVDTYANQVVRFTLSYICH